MPQKFPRQVLEIAKKSEKSTPETKRTKFNTQRKIQYDGIDFKSSLEVTCYRRLKKNNFEFSYEDEKFVIANPFTINPLVSCYYPIPTNKPVVRSTSKNKRMTVMEFKQADNKVSAITYTPDFTMEYKSYYIIIETKGKANDVYPYKRKLFLKFLSTFATLKNKKIIFFEPHSYTDIEKMINTIKSL